MRTNSCRNSLSPLLPRKCTMCTHVLTCIRSAPRLGELFSQTASGRSVGQWPGRCENLNTLDARVSDTRRGLAIAIVPVIECNGLACATCRAGSQTIQCNKPQRKSTSTSGPTSTCLCSELYTHARHHIHTYISLTCARCA